MSLVNEPDSRRTAAAIQDWLAAQIADLLELQTSELDVTKPFTYYGLSSAEAAILSVDLETWLGLPVPPTLAWDYPTIQAAARYLADQALAENRGDPNESIMP
jgi:acyl carrier protein